ncbi:MAG: radical SAM protein [Desulfobacterales bacterium]|jgi:uncharacterized protein|nr:radical SAM protein [Desulfobacterales bacterium]
MNTYFLSKFTTTLPLSVNGMDVVALFNTMSRGFCLLTPDEWQRVRELLGNPTDDQTLLSLYGNGVLIAEDADEESAIKLYREQLTHNAHMLKSRMMVTYECNCRCLYCYQEPKPLFMSEETAQKIDSYYMALIHQKHPLCVLDNYIGGEPLLNFEVVLNSASRRCHFCLGKGVGYDWGVTTNGLLLDENKLNRMLAANLKHIRVSLAGPREIHDRLRPDKQGMGTYRKIINNLKNIGGRVKVGIECQYDAGSDDYRQIPLMLDEMAAEGIHIDEIVFTPIQPRSHETQFVCGNGDFAIYTWLASEAVRRGFPMHFDPPGNYCMADIRNYLIFDVKGKILPCLLDCGELAYGDVFAGIDFRKEARILHRRMPEKCVKSCELAPLCTGGCRLQEYYRSGDFNCVDCPYDMLKASLEAHIKTLTMRALEQNTPEESIHVD